MHFFSVIVPTYNREKILDRCLNSLSKQDFDKKHYEIIVVNNNSPDGTEEVIRRYMNVYENILGVREVKQGASNARNRGAEEACGEYLIFIDDDVVAPPEYLANVVKVLSEDQPDIMGGPMYPYYTDSRPAWFRDEYEIRKYEEKSGFSRRCRVTGANFVIKKGVFKKVGMFTPELGPIGGKMNFADDAQVLDTYRDLTPLSEQKVYYALECYVMHHVPAERMKFNYLMRRSFHFGRSAVYADTLRGKSGSSGGLLTVSRGLAGVMLQLARGLVSRGPTRVDYIVLCRRFTFLLGLLAGRVKAGVGGKNVTSCFLSV